MDKKKENSRARSKDLVINSWRILKLIWSWPTVRGYFIAFGFFLLVLAGLPFLYSGLNGLVINELVELFGSGTVNKKILVLIGWLVLVGLFIPVLRRIHNYVDRMFDLSFDEEIEPFVLKRHSEIDIATKENPKMNDLFQKVSEHIYRVQNFTSRQFWMIESIIAVVIAIVIVFVIEWWILIILVLATIPKLTIQISHGNTVWNIHSGKAEIRRRFWDLRHHFTSLSNLIEIKVFQNTKFLIDQVVKLFRDFNDEQKKSEQKKARKEVWAGILSEGAFAFALVWFIYLVIQGEMQIGTFTFMVSSMGRFQNSLESFFRHLGRQYEDGLFVTDFFKFMDLPQEIEKPKRGYVLDEHKTPEIKFENVSFKYPGTDKFILKNLNLTIKPGEKVALVGVNGAGKTTFVKLLARFYDPTEGNIYVDGKNLKEIDLESWYKEMGILFQDYANYHFLVRDAISIGRTGKQSKIEKVQDAAKTAEADFFIEEWDKKYEQMLGREFSGGVEPSVGQWQKLALARTFYRDPQILILDEPTSAVDAEAEAKIFEKLESLPSDRTVFLISHRFSTVRNANKIVIIEDGQISENGTHEELLALDKTYARLFKLQARGYE